MLVTIDDISYTDNGTTKNGLPFKGYELKFTDDKGREWDQKIPAAYLKSQGLNDKFAELKPGIKTEFKMQKNEKGFWSIIDVVEPGTKAAYNGVNKFQSNITQRVEKAEVKVKTDTGRGSFADNAVGAQVGNSLNCASQILVAGKTARDLYNTALEILSVGEELKRLVVEGRIPAFDATTVVAKATTAVVTKKGAVATKQEFESGYDMDDEELPE